MLGATRLPIAARSRDCSSGSMAYSRGWPSGGRSVPAPCRWRAPDAGRRRALMSEPAAAARQPSLGLAPAVVDAMYDAFSALHKNGQTILLAEPIGRPGIGSGRHAYVLQVGRTVLQGPAQEMAHNPTSRRSISASSSLFPRRLWLL